MTLIVVAGSRSGSEEEEAPEPQLLWEADFESGDMSEFTGAGSGGVTVVNDGTAYEGTYHAVISLANGTTTDHGDFEVYGTPGSIGTQITNGWLQLRSSFDEFAGGWPSDSHKIFIVQFYDPANGSYSNAFRKYQVLLEVASDGEYVIELIEWDNEGAGTFVDGAFVTQNSTTYGPEDSFGYWDTLRLEWQLDTNGTGGLGVGNGNGVIRLWLNDELIINYTNVNICNGDTVGCGRLMLSSKATDTWIGDSTAQYWDNIQVADGASVLDAMPDAPVLRAAGSGDTNPHDYPLATVVYTSKDYNTENLADIYDGDGEDGFVAMSYRSTGGYANSGHWRATPGLSGGSPPESNDGWKALGYDGATIPATPAANSTNLLVFYYKLRLSSQFLTDMENETSGFGDSGHKILDVFMWNSGATGRDNGTRQVIKFLHTGAAGAGGLYWSHLKGGAGNEFTDDAVNDPIDMFGLPDEWFDVWHVFDRTNGVTRTYMKRASDTDVQVVLERFSSPSGGYASAPDNPYTYGTRGFNSGEGQTGLWYFWDDLTLTTNANRYVDIDSLRIGNGWFEPI